VNPLFEPAPARTVWEATVWEAEFPWEGDRLLTRLQHLPPASGPLTVRAYSSESLEVRAALKAAAMRLLSAEGRDCTVLVRSAYKTGYCWVAEELRPLWRRAQADTLRIVYPTGPEGSPDRFLQELYPLAALLERGGLHGEFEAGESTDHYHAALLRGGAEVWRGECFVPLHARLTLDGRPVVAPTGWLKVQANGNLIVDERCPTDGELVWDWYGEVVLPELLGLVSDRPGGPLLHRLGITAHLSEPDDALEVLSERLSMTEALAEDFYFGTVEALARHTGTPSGARTLRPGQIVPVISHRPGQPSWARVVLRQRGGLDDQPALEERTFVPDPAAFLPGLATGPVAPRRIWAAARDQALTHGLNWHVPAFSVGGRPIPSVVRPGGPGLLVTGGQHANETTGPVAAVEMIRLLAAHPISFAVLPLENPDGAALHRALIQRHPDHMHHAARYTALGDDLEARLHHGDTRWEAGGRAWAAEAVGARIHLNLHGYPAHEWVRPYSGYAPPGFESWALPVGFLTIVWFHPGLDQEARDLAQLIASRLNAHPDIAEQARRACRTSGTHSRQPHYDLIQGLPFIVAERAAALCPLTVITEAPDETIYGEPFQMFVRAHLAVCEAIIDYHTATGERRHLEQ
jgi:hypothetical protein